MSTVTASGGHDRRPDAVPADPAHPGTTAGAAPGGSAVRWGAPRVDDAGETPVPADGSPPVPRAPDRPSPGNGGGWRDRTASAPARWVRRLSLRGRMVLLVGVAVTAAVAVVAAIALTATRVVLYNSVDDQLLSQARNAQPDLLHGNAYSPDRRQVISADGTILDQQRPPDARALPVNAAERAVAAGEHDHYFRSVTVDGDHLRMVTVAGQVVQTGERVAIQFSRPLGDVDQTLRKLALLLGVVGLAGIAGSVGLGRLVARSALKPVDDVTDAAERVARTQDLSSLIPVSGTDEISRLAESLNSMLRALEASRERQRQLVDDASHELRTPLTSLRTNVELLMRAEANPDRSLPPADRAALMADVGAQMRELTGLVSELVALARDDGKPEDVVRIDLAEVVRSAVDRVRLRAKDAEIVVDAVPSPVVGRPSVLERAVINLVDNAVKFSPPGGQVRVTAAGGEVTVADEGPGIDEADRPHVFERFYRATSARGLPGSGLGLAIVADAAHQHGGRVDVGTSPSGGALLRFAVPMADGWHQPADRAGSGV